MYLSVNIPRPIHIKNLYTAFKAQFAKDYYFDGEAHDFWEMIFILDGNVGATANEKVYLLNKGQVIFHSPMEFHKIWAEKGTKPTVLIISFGTETMPDMASQVFHLIQENIDEAEEILKLIQENFEIDDYKVISLKENKEIEANMIVNRLENLILSILKNDIASNIKYTSTSAKNYYNIVKVLEKNIDKNLTINEIAQLCHMSSHNLRKTFYKFTGIGVVSYFNQLKVKKAIHMLQNDFNVKEVSYALGFENQNYFSTFFKRITGKSPSDYKKSF